MATSTVENYVKRLYQEQQASGERLVSMGRLAELMDVVPGTATTMIKALADSGLVSYEPRVGVRLTRGGEQLALHVLRRHRLVELFLVQYLGLDWSEVHEEAEELEHAISDKVLDRIDKLLGRPRTDPHGDPIPTARGQVRRVPQHSLNDCELNMPVRVARVLDQDPRFLQFVERSGLRPGAPVVVEQRDPMADSVVIRHDGGSATLGAAAASKIMVQR